MSRATSTGAAVRFRLVLALLALLILSACAVDPLHARRAAATAAAAQSHDLDCPAPRTDSCALDSPYRALAEDTLARSTPAHAFHYASLIERGEDALLLRIHLIRSARPRILCRRAINDPTRNSRKIRPN